MIYKIEVFGDGDVFITKLPRRQTIETCLCLTGLNEVQAELRDYGVQEMENDLKEIKESKLFESVRCF